MCTNSKSISAKTCQILKAEFLRNFIKGLELKFWPDGKPPFPSSPRRIWFRSPRSLLFQALGLKAPTTIIIMNQERLCLQCVTLTKRWLKMAYRIIEKCLAIRFIELVNLIKYRYLSELLLRI